MNLSFAGCGFLGIYHVGVVTCFREYAPKLVHKLSGASAGAIAACLLLLDCPLGQITSDVFRIAIEAREYTLGPFSPRFDVCKILRDKLFYIMPHDAYLTCSGKLSISVTRVSDGKNVILSQFNSNEELIQALLCSSFIPIFSGYIPPTFRGVRYIDGCYSDNLPVMDKNTVTVSPFCGECDICPRDNGYNLLQVNLANTSIELSTKNLYRFMRVLFPPHPEILSKMCKQGFDDALRFLQRNELISCTRCLAINSTVQFEETVEEEEKIKPTELFDINMEHTTVVIYQEEQTNCSDCKERQQVALLDDLPEAVLTVLEEACASMNNGMLNWLFKHKTMRILSVFTLPYVLPLDIAYVVAVRVMELVPKLGRDISLLMKKLLDYLMKVLANFNKHRHQYSAKFTCELAITEYDYDADDGYRTSMVTTPSFENENKNLDGSRLVSTVNFDFTVDLGKQNRAKLFRYPQVMQCSSSSKVDVACSGVLASDVLASDVSMDTCMADAASKMAVVTSNKYSGSINLPETYERILEVTRHHEAIIAYYYLDEQSKQMKVTEIFDVTDSEECTVLSADEQEINRRLSWDETNDAISLSSCPSTSLYDVKMTDEDFEPCFEIENTCRSCSRKLMRSDSAYDVSIEDYDDESLDSFQDDIVFDENYIKHD